MKNINWLTVAGIALTGIASVVTAIASSKEVSKAIPKEVAKQLSKKS